MRASWTRWWTALGIAALTSCSSREQLAAPTLHSITGHLRLTGYLVNPDGSYAGTRVLGDADGIAVELLQGSQVVGRTTTVGGVYSFSGLGPGEYIARSRVIGTIRDQTNTLVIAVSDVVAADTLRLVSFGDLFPVPNPFVDTTQVYFDVPDTMRVDMNILDAAGNTIKNLLALEVRPGLQAVFWNGRDTQGHPATGSLYWVTYVAGDDVRAHLLFKQGPIPNRAREGAPSP